MNPPVIRCARHLHASNRFKIAGTTYQVADTSPNDLGQLIIWCFPIDDRSKSLTLIVDFNTKFKLYPRKK